MPDTRGFEIVAQITEESVLKIFRAAWKCGGDDSEQGVIPEVITLDNSVQFGPYHIEEGVVLIPRERLGLELAPTINGIDLKLDTVVHLKIQDPPIPSATLFDMNADIHIHAPVVVLDSATNQVGVRLENLPAGAITAAITSGNPIVPITNAAISEAVHKKYREGLIPHNINNIPISFPPFSMKADITFFDDESNPSRQITTSQPDAGHVRVEIPCHIRFYDIAGNFNGFSLSTPMAVNGNARIVAPFQQNPGSVTAALSIGTVTLEDLTPAPGTEGANYTSNKNLIGFSGLNLDNIVKNGFNGGATARLHAMGDISVMVPTLADIENFIATKVREELQRRRFVALWRPEVPTDENGHPRVVINDLAIKVLADAFSICLNGGGGDPASLVNFIPAGRDFAIGISEGKVDAEFNRVKNDYGVPHHYRGDEKINGYEADLNRLDISLAPGAIHLDGDVTVIDAVLGSIDVGAEFEANVGLEWQDGANGGQIIHPFLLGDPDVDLSVWTYILGFLVGLFTFGILGGIIAVVIVAVVEGVVEGIGGKVVRDEVTGQISVVSALPQDLDHIGKTETRFLNPIGIAPDGLIFAGSMTVVSNCESTPIDFADSNGPYSGAGGAPMAFHGGTPQSFSNALWAMGNGVTLNDRNPIYNYGQSGLFIAKVQIKVLETGGVTTAHYTRVRIENKPPVVTIGPPITVYEGEPFDIIARFTDDEWLDTHTAIFDFGDNTAPAQASITEINNPPQAVGEAKASHTYCDDGTYIIRIRVTDIDGGIGEAETTVTVLNVPPKISAPRILHVLRDQTVVLQAVFSDPGWCDTHRATWDCGNCTLRDATIREWHKTPRLVGLAEASHNYVHCGRYLAHIEVTDDDGGKDAAGMIVHVNELKNAWFEKGFYHYQREKVVDTVANEWVPYTDALLIADKKNSFEQIEGPADFFAEEYIGRDGRRAQGIRLQGGHAGIRQTVMVNRSWAYEFTAHYHTHQTERDSIVIGIDPIGGTDPASSSIIWVRDTPPGEGWRNISVRALAQTDHITVFFGAQNQNRRTTIELFLDSTALYFIQPPYPMLLRTISWEDQTPTKYVPDSTDDFPENLADGFSDGQRVQIIRILPEDKKRSVGSGVTELVGQAVNGIASRAIGFIAAGVVRRAVFFGAKKILNRSQK